MALELGSYKIRVNTVNPTVTMTEMGKLGWSNATKAQEMINKIPLGRFAGNFYDTFFNFEKKCKSPE
jgi:L-xylulose reductase